MRGALVLIIWLFALTAVGQSLGNDYYYGCNIAASPIQATIDISIGKSAFIDSKNKFGLNSTIKLSSTGLSNRAIYATPNESDESGIDKIKNASVGFGSLNLNFGGSYRLTDNWLFGLETDLLGFNLAKDTEGEFSPSGLSQKNGPTRSSVTTSFKANSPNLMLFSDKNKGVIRSAVYAQYQTATVGYKCSILYSSTRIKTDSFIGNKGNNRFVNNDFLLGFGMIFKIK